MSKPTLVIAVAGISGAGKSTLIHYLVGRLGNVNALMLDQYEATSHYPHIEQWFTSGADPNEFKLPQFDADIQALVEGRSITHPETGQAVEPAPFLILEEPFGRSREPLRNLIDLVVFVETPLEVAYARKISRKNAFLPWEDDPELFVRHLRENVDWYLRMGRRFYLAVAERARQDADLIVDGLLPTEQIADEILKEIDAG